MSPCELTSAEWQKVNQTVPDIRPVIDHIIEWPYVEYIFANADSSVTSQLRLSNVRFRDSVESLRKSRYALVRAIAMRKCYMDRRESEQDKQNLALAEFHGSFYVDYVPLLLYTTVEHAQNALLDLFGYRTEYDTNYKKGYALQRLLRLFEDKRPHDNLVKVLSIFDESPSRENVWKYRNAWVHDKPKRVESALYNPPYEDFIFDEGPLKMIAIGAKKSPDYEYKWDDLIQMLMTVLSETAEFINKCLEIWDREYKQYAN